MLHPALTSVSLIHEVNFELAYQCTFNIIIIFESEIFQIGLVNIHELLKYSLQNIANKDYILYHILYVNFNLTCAIRYAYRLC